MRTLWLPIAGLIVVLGTEGMFAQEPAQVLPTPPATTVSDHWTVPPPSTLRRELEGWLGSEDVVEPQKREEVLARWSDAESVVVPPPTLPGNVLFERTIESMRQASETVSDYLKTCDVPAWQELPFGQPLVLPQVPLQVYLGDSSSPYLLGSLRFYLALKLVQARLYDEAAPILDEMTPENSVDPVAVLLTKALVNHHLSRSEKGLEALEGFKAAAEHDLSVPRRHVELAKLLEFDLKKSKTADDPQNISRKMDDVRRRLGKGRTDDDTQQAEKDVMKSLDQLIEKIEEQCKKQGQGDSDQGRQANNPADDSRILKQKGPGNVDRRDFDPEGNWGDLPPKEREEALMRIEKEFPAHYRDIIEQYFREMATVESP